MNNEAYAFALKSTLNEIKNVCPEISHTFIFKENQGMVAKDENTDQETIENTATAFNALVEVADVIGGLESATFQGSDGRVSITHFKDFYLTTVASNEADEKTVINLTRVLVPTMLKLVQKTSQSLKENFEETMPKQEPETVEYSETPVPDLMASQFTVENLGLSGVLGSPNVVRLDRILIGQWNELYGDNKIEEAIIEETKTGKSLHCKFKPITDSKYEDKGVIQISEAVQHKLTIKKGDQVLVKPVIKGQNENGIILDETEQANMESQSNGEVEVYRADEPYMPDPLVSQFMVENLNGLGSIGNSDTVRIDPEVIQQWNDLYGDKKIEELIVEDTITGQTLRCKFKPIKGSKFEGKGVIQMSEKAQLALQTRKGALVMIKPVIGNQ